MNKIDPKDNIKKLTEELNHHNYLYYHKSEPVISDYEFDQKLKELERLEAAFPHFKLPYSPTARIGGDITKTFETVQHKYPMRSLANTYSIEELQDFDNRVEKGLGTSDYEYFCELKFDGVAISLIYEDGILRKAVTRGDGNKGDDITANVKTIRTIPLKIRGEVSRFFEVRGEVFMPKQAFVDLNRQREEEGESLLANPRNTTSGTLKMQDSGIVAKRKLDCYLYAYMDENETFHTHEESILFLSEAGFNVSPTFKKCSNIEEVTEYIRNWEQKRHELPVETDGVVVKVNNLNHQAELGFTAKNPRWAIAYKYKAESGITTLRDVSYQVGRTGAITPVAELTPVFLAGTTVKRASLHNANEIERLGIRIGDTVRVEKGGEIIPKITGIDLAQRPKDSQPLAYIQKCPICRTPLMRNEGEAQHYCPNQEACPPQVHGRIEHFISRNAMDIVTLGPRTIHGLLHKGLIKNVADLYQLTYEQLNGIQLEETDENGQVSGRSIKDKTATNIVKSIEQSKQTPFERVLFGLGIRYVGITVADKLAHHFENIDRLKEASFEEIISVHEIGDRIADSVIAYFQNEKNVTLVNELKAHGLNMKIATSQKQKTRLKNRIFVVSGVFEGYGRDEIKELIKAHGGKVTTSVSTKTNYLVAGSNMGPSKKKKAEALGIPILNEADFSQLISDD